VIIGANEGVAVGIIGGIVGVIPGVGVNVSDGVEVTEDVGLTGVRVLAGVSDGGGIVGVGFGGRTAS
jgi:hypothetical protein